MLPKNNRTMFADQNGSCQTSNTNQQFRPSITVASSQFPFNQNLVVTQQQQPMRVSNTHQIISPSNSNLNNFNQIELAKRLAAAVTPSQNSSVNIINRQNPSTQSPTLIQVNQNNSSDINRSSMVRIPSSQADTNNLYQTLLCIQQNYMLQNDKSKQVNTQISDIVKTNNPINSTIHNSPVVLNNPSNSLAAIAINSSLASSQNQNTTVLTMSNIDAHLLEAISRLNPQNQPSKPNQSSIGSNLYIQSDSVVAQQLLNALQKQSPRSTTGFNSPGVMLIGQTTKASQTCKPSVVASAVVNPGVTNDSGTSLLMKNPSSSKSDSIPLWKFLDDLSNNQESRIFKNRECNDNSIDRSKLISPHSNIQRSIEYIIANKPSPKPTNNADTHQILRDSKEISYLMPNSNSNSNISNDEMINHHFKKSLCNKFDPKKSIEDNNQMNKGIDDVSTSQLLHVNTKAKSLIDLEKPECLNERNLDKFSKTKPSNYVNPNSKLSIKQTTDAMVENLLLNSISNSSSSKQYQSSYNTNLSYASSLNDFNPVSPILSSAGLNKVQVSVSAQNLKFPSNNSNLVENAAPCSLNNVNNHSNNNNNNGEKLIKLTKSTINPSKHDLPLKKRIMWDFNENCNETADTETKNIDVNCSEDVEMKTVQSKTDVNLELSNKQNKMRRKRSLNDSVNVDYKIDSPSADLASVVVKKRRGRMPGTGKKQKLHEEFQMDEMTKLKPSGSEDTWIELHSVVNRPPDMDRICSKTLGVLDLEPYKVNKQPFFQIGQCNEIAPRMVKCRSCRQNAANNNVEQSTNTTDDVSSVKSGSKDSSTTTVVSSFCRFHGFRKLQFSSKGTLTHAGFCKSREADSLDLSLWRMYYPLPSDLSTSSASYFVELLSDIFCEIIDAECQFVKESCDNNNDSSPKSCIRKRTIFSNGIKPSKSDFDELVWKRPVQGVREMCDVCETSIFNTHWVCRKCGYSVCIDCFNELIERNKLSEKESETRNGISSFKSEFHQNTRGAHRNRSSSKNYPWAACTANRQPHNPEQLLKAELIPFQVLHELRNRMHTVAKLLQLRTKCGCLNKSKQNFLSSKLSKQISSDSIPVIEANTMSCENDLHLLAELALKEDIKEARDPAIFESTEKPSQSGSYSNILRTPPVLSPPHHPECTSYSNGVENHDEDVSIRYSSGEHPTYSWVNVASSIKILRLHHAQNPENFKRFQQEWHFTRPLIVSGCHKSMDSSLWTPEKFLEDFETEAVQLVDCETGFPVSKGTMKSFWEGFESYSKRITSEGKKKPACLKLKDWPPCDDFNDVLPLRCRDILANLPIQQYTGRSGELNLASHLPEFFVRPDLGPKLYNAYGMPKDSKLGTTNLHLDIADAVNIMLYIGVPKDNLENEKAHALETVKEAIFDENVIKRAENELPGALWHIFLPKDVPKLRQFLYTVLTENGEVFDSNQDPIHDQLFYLDKTMLNRLKAEYGVEGCAVVQFKGDAIFIPAGSPHQVRNLHSCIKAANDFVSPENILQCLQVTKEFRQLSPTHANHEDKLQAKNMIFHAIKDSVATLIAKNSNLYNEYDSKGLPMIRKRRLPQQIDDKTSPITTIKTEEQTPMKDIAKI